MNDNTQAQAVKLDLTGLVRGLEWVETPSGQKYACDGFGGYYYLDEDGDHWRHSNDPDCWRVGGIDGVQANYAEIILAALDTDAIAALVEALQPLAKMADRYDPGEGDDDLECWSGLATPKIKHLRAARAALARLGGVE
jgi:hypothetical protein